MNKQLFDLFEKGHYTECAEAFRREFPELHNNQPRLKQMISLLDIEIDKQLRATAGEQNNELGKINWIIYFFLLARNMFALVASKSQRHDPALAKILPMLKKQSLEAAGQEFEKTFLFIIDKCLSVN